MRRIMITALTIAFIGIIVWIHPAVGADMDNSKTIDGLRIDVHVLPTKALFTEEEAKAKQMNEGMLVMGGASPVLPDSSPRPNHHIVVHVYSKEAGKALTDASVTISYQKLDAQGNQAGPAVTVPVVIMQAIGKGPQSTHYGNNVIMPAGMYSVVVVVNGKKAHFHMHVGDGSSEQMKMH